MINPSTSYTIPFVTMAAGVLTAADSTPTAVLWRNGSAEATSVTVSTTSNTGIYHAVFTTESGWAKTDRIWLVVSAVIATKTYRSIVWDSFGEPDAIMRGTDSAYTGTPPTAAAIADAVYEEPYADHETPNTYGFLWSRWRKANPAIAGEVVAGTLSTTQFSSDITTYGAEAFRGATLLFINGSTYAEFASPIVEYNPTGGVFTLEKPLPAAPQVGDEFIVQPANFVHTIASVTSGVWSALTSGLNVVGSTGRALARLIGLVEDSSGDRFTAKALEEAPSGTSTVTVLPALGVAAGRGDRTTLVAYVAETITTSITVYQSDGTTAYDLSGKTLAVIFENPKTGDDVAVVASGSITISGTDSNVVSFAYPSAATSAQRELTWTLRDAAAPKTVYLRGVLEVRAAATVD